MDYFFILLTPRYLTCLLTQPGNCIVKGLMLIPLAAHQSLSDMRLCLHIVTNCIHSSAEWKVLRLMATLLLVIECSEMLLTTIMEERTTDSQTPGG